GGAGRAGPGGTGGAHAARPRAPPRRHDRGRRASPGAREVSPPEARPRVPPGGRAPGPRRADPAVGVPPAGPPPLPSVRARANRGTYLTARGRRPGLADAPLQTPL